MAGHKKIKDLPLNMPCSDPEGCKHFKNEIKLRERIKELEGEIQEVSNQLMDLYELCSETTRPAVYGTILGLHERLEQTLKG